MIFVIKPKDLMQSGMLYLAIWFLTSAETKRKVKRENGAEFPALKEQAWIHLKVIKYVDIISISSGSAFLSLHGPFPHPLSSLGLTHTLDHKSIYF